MDNWTARLAWGRTKTARIAARQAQIDAQLHAIRARRLAKIVAQGMG